MDKNYIENEFKLIIVTSNKFRTILIFADDALLQFQIWIYLNNGIYSIYCFTELSCGFD